MSVTTLGPVSVSGTFSCGTNAATTGALSSGAITSTGAFSCGTNAATTGALSSSSFTSSGLTVLDNAVFARQGMLITSDSNVSRGVGFVNTTNTVGWGNGFYRAGGADHYLTGSVEGDTCVTSAIDKSMRIGHGSTASLVANASGVTVPGTLTAGDTTASSVHVWTTKAITSQGAHLQWNKPGGDGRLYLINQKGGGTGGLSFGESTAGTVTPSVDGVYTELMGIDTAGNLKLTGYPYNGYAVWLYGTNEGRSVSTTIAKSSLPTGMYNMTVIGNYTGGAPVWASCIVHNTANAAAFLGTWGGYTITASIDGTNININSNHPNEQDVLITFMRTSSF